MSHQDQNWQNNASNAVCALSIGSWNVVENLHFCEDTPYAMVV